MFYRNISRYINKLCGWWQRLVAIARLQCTVFNNLNCDDGEGERRRKTVFSVLTGTFQKVPEKILHTETVTSDTLTS